MSQRVTIEQLAEWLRAREDIVIMGHVSPDGDATGCALAVWHALRALGKRAVVCLPKGVPVLYKHLPGAHQVMDTEAGQLPFAPKTALAVDVSDHERLGEAGKALFDSCEFQGVLDHHGTNTGFGQLYALDGEAAAAGEILLDMIEAMGVKLDPVIAECLFVAISTDCGQFSFPNTRPETFRAAARCVEAGADVSRITEELYRTRSVGRTKLLATVLSGLELSPDGKVAWARLTQQMLRDCGANRADNEGIINYLLEMEGVQVAVLAIEREGGESKMSLRSKNPFDVARDVAIPLGGGGHSNAAGASLYIPLEEALQKTLGVIREALKAGVAKTDKA